MPILRKPSPSKSSALERLSRHTDSSVKETKWVMDVPFEWRAWASTVGIRWDASQGVSVYSGESLPPELLPFAARPFSFEWRQQARLNPSQNWQPSPLLPAWQARPHQKEAADAMLAALRIKRVGFLLADDVGVGKTISAWDFALRSPLKKILIVTTVSAIAHWRNTLLHVGWGDKEVVIINYDRLGKLFDMSEKNVSTRAKGKRKRVATNGEPESFDLIVFDEAHKGKNITSARSVMMRRLSQRAKFTVWASATAGQDPLELAYLATLLAQVTGSRLSDMKEFEQWCVSQNLGVSRGGFGKWQWDGDRKALQKIRSWLFEGKVPAGIRRLPQDVAGWQAMERQVVPVALTPEETQAFNASWEEFRRVYIQNLPPANQKKRTKQQKEIALVAQLRFRQKASWLRIPSTIEQMVDHLENNKRVAISVAFHETLEEIAKQLRAAKIEPALIHGKLSPVEKENQRLRFQKGQTPVCLFTVEEAISLHQGEYEDVPRVLLIHDIRWSALQSAQIEGRCHRDGKFAPTQWMYAEGTVEEKIVRTLIERVIAMKTMHGDDTSDLEALEAILFAEAA
jgi:hypothetical protein